jgi:D-alanine-D-alanine ligase
MRVGLAVVMQRSDAPEEADFTTEDEVRHMTVVLEQLGHDVRPVEFGAPLPDIVTAIERATPEVIFNTVEQVRGEGRPAGFVPTVCAGMGIPCTGPGPRAIAIGSDKWLTKRVVPPGPVTFAPDVLVTTDRPWDGTVPDGLLPAIVKPNHGGSSQGIADDAVASSPAEVEAALARLAPFLDTGVIVERFVTGRDITVGLVRSGDAWRVLAPIEYETPSTGGHHLLTEGLKRWAGWDEVVPRRADLTADQLRDLEAHVLATVRAIGANGVARMDYRLAEPEGRLVALEINAIANLEPGAGMVLSAEYAGLGYQDLISAMLTSARPGW